jgi:hypothetical protein
MLRVEKGRTTNRKTNIVQKEGTMRFPPVFIVCYSL